MVGNRTYFEIDVTESWLTIGRSWLREYQPMLYLLTEFQYDGKSEVAPFVIGPQLLSRLGEDVPTSGVRFTNTRVSGPHPFTGHIAVSLVLCAVETDDHARDLLNTVESTVKVLDMATAVVPYLKVAELALNGVDSLLGAGKLRSIVGHRSEFDHRDRLFSPHYLALVRSDNLERENLWVRRGQLEVGDAAESAQPLRETDFVLLRLSADVRRDDVDRLPFAETKKRAFAQADRATLSGPDKRKVDPLWCQAKATLFNLEQEALDSPDLIEPHVDELREAWRARMLVIREQAERRIEMGPKGDETPEDKRQRKAAAALDL